jgi:hypothetical protein
VVLIGNLSDFFTNPVVSRVADAGVSVPVIGRVFGALDTDTSNSYITYFTEAAVLKEILVSSACWWDKGITSKCDSVVDFIHSTLTTLESIYSGALSCGGVDNGCGDCKSNKALSANTGLCISIIDLVNSAGNEDASTVLEGEAC